MNKVSIIIPNYNCSKYIDRTMNSIINQSYKNYEIIFVDDGSTDNSVEIVEKYKNKLKNKLIIIRQFNQNASVARNRGIEIASGKYALFIDSDDELYDNNTLENMVNSIDGYDLLLGNYVRIDENGIVIKEYYNKDDYLEFKNKYKYVGISPVPTSKLYCIDIIKEKNLYFSNVKIGQDLNFFFKYLLFAKKIKIVDSFLYKYRILSTSMSRIKNTNFIDIYNSTNEVRKYYILNNKEKEFYKYIAPTCVGNISGQLEKVRFIKNRKTKKMVYSYLDYAINDLEINNKYKTNFFKEKVLKYKIKSLLIKLRLYK